MVEFSIIQEELQEEGSGDILLSLTSSSPVRHEVVQLFMMNLTWLYCVVRLSLS